MKNPSPHEGTRVREEDLHELQQCPQVVRKGCRSKAAASEEAKRTLNSMLSH